VPDEQAKNDYSDEVIAALEQSLSTDRLNSYILMAAGDRHKAILLHERNTRLSEGLFGVIQGLEIALRNRIHKALQSGIGAEDWYERVLLRESEVETLQFAKKTLLTKKKPISPPHIISQLNFGFWVRLTSGDYEKTLWVPHLYKVFPEKTKRSSLSQRLNKIKDLRNKIAHHERILDRNLDGDYELILDTIKWLCPLTSSWIRGNNRFGKPI
jgi:hypothetical protein